MINQVTLTSSRQRPLKPLIEAALDNEMRLLQIAIQRTERHLEEFEVAYGMASDEFVRRFENDDLPETLDFVDWIGEYRLLSRFAIKPTPSWRSSLLIDVYFRQIAELIENCAIVQSANVAYDKRGRHEGYIRGELYFVDGSILHIREFVDVEDQVDRLTYAYQYMNANQALVFRYDNTGHHRKLLLPTYPHHKHVSGKTDVIASSAPHLTDVLDEILMSMSWT